MDLSGWDTVSVIAIERVNAAMAARAEALIGAFDFRAGSLRIRGRFEPWRIVRGGTPKLLRLETPIADLVIEGLPGRSAVSLPGAVATHEVALKLIPAARGGHDLVFDLDERDEPEGGAQARAVRPLGVEAAGQELDAVTRRLLPDAVSRCLAAHAAEVSYVFAQTGSVGASGWLRPRRVSWGYVETAAGAHLALFGLLSDRPSADLATLVDPRMLAAPSAFAVSAVRWAENVLAPTMAETTRRPFETDAKGRVRNRKPFPVPGGEANEAVVRSMTLWLEGAALRTQTKGSAKGPLGVVIDYAVATTMPFVFDPKTGASRFKPDPEPRVSHSGHAGGPLGWLIDWLVRIVLHFSEASTNALIRQVTAKNQAVAAEVVNAVGWQGARTFKPSRAELADALVLYDDRA